MNFIEYIQNQGWAARTKGEYIYWFRRWQFQDPDTKPESIQGFLNDYPNGMARAMVKNYIEWAGLNVKLERRKGRAKKKLPRWLTFEEVRKLADAADLKHKVLILLLFETGLRVSEACALTPSNIDIDNSMLRGIGKGNKEYAVRIRKAMTGSLLKVAMPLCLPDEPIFKMTRNTAGKYIRQLSQKVLGKRISPHVLRHSYAMYLLSKGLNIKEVQVKMRHENVATTGIYLHANPEEIDKKIEGIFEVKE